MKEKYLKKRKNKNNTNHICKICDKELNVNIDHFESKKHIDNFDNNIEISIKKSIEEKFININFKFKITTEGVFYNDLYFKKLQNKGLKKHG